MAYTILLTDNTIFATIPDGTINNDSTMVLIGKNYAGYGEFLDQNFIRLLENGANTLPPLAPLIGQLWYDKTANVMKVYNGDIFKIMTGSTASAAAPSPAVAGDLWFDTVNQQLKVYNGTAYVLVGPASSSGQGTSGAIVTTVQDNLGTPGGHVIIQLFVQNTLVGVISKDATFTPSPAIAGFTTISPGIQLSTAVASNLFRGTSTDSQLLDGLDSSQFLRSDQNDSTSGTLSIINNTGLYVGANQEARLLVSTNDVSLLNQASSGNLLLRVNPSGTPTTAVFVNGTTGAVSIPTVLGVTGNVTAPNFIGNLVGNFSGTVAAPGANTQVVFNDAGNLNATSALTINKNNGALAATGTISGGALSVAGAITVNTGGTASPSIINGAANAVGNIGSASTFFNTVFAANLVGTATTALTAGTATNVSGTVAIINGGTGQTTSAAALNALLPAQASQAGKFLTTDGLGNITWAAVAGSGTVTSVAASTSLNGLSFGGTPITTSGTLTLSGTLGVQSGGTGANSLTANAVLIGNGTSQVGVVSPGTNGNVLTASGGTWVSQAPGAGSGTVTSVALSGGTTGLTVSGSPITTSGTLTLGGALAIANGGTGSTTDSGARSNLGLGTMATQNSNNVSISGGTISGITLSGYVDTSSTQTVNGQKTFNSIVGPNGFNLTGNTSMNYGGSTISLDWNGNVVARLDDDGTSARIRLKNSNWGMLSNSTQLQMGLYASSTAYIALDSSRFRSGLDTCDKPTAGQWAGFSDRRLKTDISSYEKGLASILALKPVYYRFNDVKPIGEATKHRVNVGLIAQEVQETDLGSMIRTEDDGYLQIDPSELTYTTINAIKELAAEVQSLKAELAALKGQQ